jgi:uncharacterized membrane protein HdeD (DUF308 family)
MLHVLAKNWWAVALRGACAVIFGLLAFAWPGVTLGALVLLWGAYAFADGIFAIVSAFSGSSGEPWWVLALEGVVGLGAAAAAFFYPGLTTLVLLYIIAAWAIVTGVLEIVVAIRLRKEIEGEFWLALAGLASLGFGFLLIARPLGGALAVVWLIGAYAIAFGVMLIALGFRLKGHKGHMDRSTGVAATPATRRA